MRNKLIILGLVSVLFFTTKVGKGFIENPITEALLHNIARVESSHNPKAVSKKGAYGLHQVRWKVWGEELKKQKILSTKSDLFDPEKNKKAAIFILNTYWYQTKDLKKTLHKYSGGSKNYPDKVLNGR